MKIEDLLAIVLLVWSTLLGVWNFTLIRREARHTKWFNRACTLDERRAKAFGEVVREWRALTVKVPTVATTSPEYEAACRNCDAAWGDLLEHVAKERL